MQVNSVASYNNQLHNRTNVKFGACKKIVCEEAMFQAKNAFEKNKTWKSILDKLYDYEVHFISDILPEQIHKENNYMMILKPCENSSQTQANSDSILENLPTTIFIEAKCLKDVNIATKYDSPNGFHERAKYFESGLITKINNLIFEEDIFPRINMATKKSKIVKVERTTRK